MHGIWWRNSRIMQLCFVLLAYDTRYLCVCVMCAQADNQITICHNKVNVQTSHCYNARDNTEIQMNKSNSWWKLLSSLSLSGLLSSRLDGFLIVFLRNSLGLLVVVHDETRPLIAKDKLIKISHAAHLSADEGRQNIRLTCECFVSMTRRFCNIT